MHLTSKDINMLKSSVSKEKVVKIVDNIISKVKLKNEKIDIKKFEKLTKLKIKKIHHSRIHGWMYSSNSKPLKQLSLWNKSLKLGLCGDYFGGPRLENGWQSAHDLYSKIRYGK